MTNRVYLGRGLEFPIRLLQGKGTITSDVSLINQSIKIILDTPIGSRLFLPDFGSRLSELLFEPNDEVLHDLLSLFISQSLDKWENRIKVLGVDCAIENELAVSCTISYKVLNSNEIESFIYPFYKKVA
jgi:hypothetical protein